MTSFDAPDAAIGNGGAAGGGLQIQLPTAEAKAVQQQRSIFELDLDQLDQHPWRKPGADLSDYFNYGFTEETWRLYSAKQQRLRQENAMQGKIQSFEASPGGMMMNQNMNPGGAFPPPDMYPVDQQQQPSILMQHHPTTQMDQLVAAGLGGLTPQQQQQALQAAAAVAAASQWPLGMLPMDPQQQLQLGLVPQMMMMPGAGVGPPGGVPAFYPPVASHAQLIQPPGAHFPPTSGPTGPIVKTEGQEPSSHPPPTRSGGSRRRTFESAMSQQRDDGSSSSNSSDRRSHRR